MGQRALVIVLAALGAVAVASGLNGILLGPGSIPGGAETTASVDSNYRFAQVFWFAAGAGLWWSLRRLRERRHITRLMLALAFLGGIARLISVVVTGWPHPVFIGVLALELVVIPVVLWWHARVVSSPTVGSAA